MAVKDFRYAIQQSGLIAPDNIPKYRRASWWRIGKRRLSPVAQAELARIKAILAGGGNG